MNLLNVSVVESIVNCDYNVTLFKMWCPILEKTIATTDIIFIMQTLVAFLITYLLLTGTQFLLTVTKEYKSYSLTVTLLMNAGLKVNCNHFKIRESCY